MKIYNGKKLAETYLKRSGVIPFTFDSNNKLYFLLAVDRLSGQYSDFGGHAENKESALSTAFREFYQESRASFKNHYSINDCDHYISLANNNMAILFLPLERKMLINAKKLFYKSFNNKKLVERHFFEVSDVEWVSEQTFLTYIKMEKWKSPMWPKISNFLKEEYMVESVIRYINLQQNIF